MVSDDDQDSPMSGLDPLALPPANGGRAGDPPHTGRASQPGRGRKTTKHRDAAKSRTLDRIPGAAGVIPFTPAHRTQRDGADAGENSTISTGSAGGSGTEAKIGPPEWSGKGYRTVEPRLTRRLTQAERADAFGTKPARLQSSPRERLRKKLRDLATEKGLQILTLPGMDALQLSIRYLEGGREMFLTYVQLAMQNQELPAVQWWMVYADLTPAERADVSLDDVCAASGVRPADLLASVVGCAVEHAADIGNLMAAVLHPKVIHQAGKSAMRIGGRHAQIALRDREMLLQHQGFVPVPKNAVINVGVRVSGGANATAAATANQNPALPSFLGDVASVQAPREQIQRQMLTEGVPAERVVLPVRDAELVKEDR